MRYTEFSIPAVATSMHTGVYTYCMHTHIPGKPKRNMGAKTYLGALSVQVVIEIIGEVR